MVPQSRANGWQFLPDWLAGGGQYIAWADAAAQQRRGPDRAGREHNDLGQLSDQAGLEHPQLIGLMFQAVEQGGELSRRPAIPLPDRGCPLGMIRPRPT